MKEQLVVVQDVVVKEWTQGPQVVPVVVIMVSCITWLFSRHLLSILPILHLLNLTINLWGSSIIVPIYRWKKKKKESKNMLSYPIVSLLWLHTKKIFLFQKLSFRSRLGNLVCLLVRLEEISVWLLLLRWRSLFL